MATPDQANLAIGVMTVLIVVFLSLGTKKNRK